MKHLGQVYSRDTFCGKEWYASVDVDAEGAYHTQVTITGDGDTWTSERARLTATTLEAAYDEARGQLRALMQSMVVAA